MANNIVEGEWDWMSQIPGANPSMGMGFPSPAPARVPGIMDRMGGMLGGGQSFGGLLGEDEKKAAQRQALMAMAAQLMSASGPSQQRVSFGQALGPALMAGQQAYGQAGQDALQAMLLKTKLQTAGQTTGQKDYQYAVANGYKGTFEDWKRSGTKASSGVQEYEYAKSNGYKGSFEEWKRVASAQTQPTSDVQNWEYFQKLTPEQQKQWMSLQRQPTAPQLAVINGVPTLVDRIQGTQTPLTTLQSEIGATTAKAGAEAEAKALGSAKGEAQGGLAKKGINAMNVLETIDLADPLIDVATGSATGAAADKVAAFFGKSTSGDQAIAQLKIVQANLMTNMPRMEGPQSDRDVQLYREAAGEIGDANVPRARKKAAISMIRALQQKYTDGMPVPPSANRPPLSSFQK